MFKRFFSTTISSFNMDKYFSNRLSNRTINESVKLYVINRLTRHVDQTYLSNHYPCEIIWSQPLIPLTFVSLLKDKGVYDMFSHIKSAIDLLPNNIDQYHVDSDKTQYFEKHYDVSQQASLKDVNECTRVVSRLYVDKEISQIADIRVIITTGVFTDDHLKKLNIPHTFQEYNSLYDKSIA